MKILYYSRALNFLKIMLQTIIKTFNKFQKNSKFVGTDFRLTSVIDSKPFLSNRKFVPQMKLLESNNYIINVVYDYTYNDPA